MATKLYVGNLSFKTTGDDLREYFSQAGEVESASHHGAAFLMHHRMEFAVLVVSVEFPVHPLSIRRLEVLRM